MRKTALALRGTPAIGERSRHLGVHEWKDGSCVHCWMQLDFEGARHPCSRANRPNMHRPATKAYKHLATFSLGWYPTPTHSKRATAALQYLAEKQSYRLLVRGLPRAHPSITVAHTELAEDEYVAFVTEILLAHKIETHHVQRVVRGGKRAK